LPSDWLRLPQALVQPPDVSRQLRVHQPIAVGLSLLAVAPARAGFHLFVKLGANQTGETLLAL
jgi:hypothetical protein